MFHPATCKGHHGLRLAMSFSHLTCVKSTSWGFLPLTLDLTCLGQVLAPHFLACWVPSLSGATFPFLVSGGVQGKAKASPARRDFWEEGTVATKEYHSYSKLPISRGQVRSSYTVELPPGKDEEVASYPGSPAPEVSAALTSSPGSKWPICDCPISRITEDLSESHCLIIAVGRHSHPGQEHLGPHRLPPGELAQVCAGDVLLCNVRTGIPRSWWAHIWLDCGLLTRPLCLSFLA